MVRRASMSRPLWRLATGQLRLPKLFCTQDGDGAGEADSMRPHCRCSKNDRWLGIEELAAVMFTDAKRVQACLIVERRCDTVNSNLHWVLHRIERP